MWHRAWRGAIAVQASAAQWRRAAVRSLSSRPSRGHEAHHQHETHTAAHAAHGVNTCAHTCCHGFLWRAGKKSAEQAEKDDVEIAALEKITAVRYRAMHACSMMCGCQEVTQMKACCMLCRGARSQGFSVLHQVRLLCMHACMHVSTLSDVCCVMGLGLCADGGV